ncbi:Protein kinase domain-containing protein [Meloidogyne graminicola]|uniref:Protein kinase domain-containing protein n=1 Tax=Meloidogyne graminicola TaxID=189291 RepID=A0A8S9ZNS6_9BILA|nr:Protein kinase domain-containing protein [Meloidogyne graminicola]
MMMKRKKEKKKKKKNEEEEEEEEGKKKEKIRKNEENDEEEESWEEEEEEEDSLCSTFAEFKIGENGSILNEKGMIQSEEDDEEYETSVEEIIQLPNKNQINPTVGVQAVIRTILRNGTELARIKLNNLAVRKKNEEDLIVEELKPLNNSILLSPLESEEEFSEEEWEEEEEIELNNKGLISDKEGNEIPKMSTNFKQIDEDSISIYSDALEGPPELITLISIKNEEKEEIKFLEEFSPLPVLRREIRKPVERSLEVKLRSGGNLKGGEENEEEGIRFWKKRKIG